MSSSATITREQLREVIIATELGGKMGDSAHFSYAELGNSAYSFGQLQYDVGHNDAARNFLAENGFNAADIKDLSSHGGLTRERLDILDAKLKAIPQIKVEQFTNNQLDKTIAGVGDVIDSVRRENPAAADAIVKDPKLQLGIADYTNQFGSVGPQLIGFLAGKEETIKATGITVKAGNPATREDIQAFINATPYGYKKANALGVEGRAEHFNEAMAELKLGPAVTASHHTASTFPKQGSHGEQVQKLQTQLGELGYLDNTAMPDGKYGPATRDAVKAYQHDHHLPEVGQAGPATQKAIQADLQPLRQDNAGPLPAVSAMSSLPYGAPGLDDPRNALNPHHVLYSKLQQRLPDASDQRLLQFTAVCHSMGITGQNLTNITFDRQNGIVNFAGNDNFAAKTASVDVKIPGPPADQSIQHIQQTDQFRAQLQTKIDATIAQNNLQGPQGPTPGGAPGR